MKLSLEVGNIDRQTERERERERKGLRFERKEA
jgi:hypothetical protein